jgi:DNA-binding response OmpR family regulator
VGLLIAGARLVDGSGVALARTMKTIRPQTPVVMLASRDDLDDTFDGYLAKPIDPQRLLALVRSALKQHAPS